MAGRESESLYLLQLVHFLRGLSEDAVRELMGQLRPVTLEPDEVLHEQGSRMSALYFILAGKLELAERDEEGQLLRRVHLTAGDTVGESEIVLDLPWLAGAKAVEATQLLQWKREAVYAFLEQRPDAFDHMRFAAASRQLARRLRFPWLADDEVTFGLARKHPFLLALGMIVPAAILLFAAGLEWLALRGGGAVPAYLGLGLALVGVGYGVWQWIDWGNDYYIVTNRRAVWLEKVVALYDSRREAPLHQVLAVSTSTDVLGRILGYGDVIVRTFTTEIVFKNLANPASMAAMIDEHYRRAQIVRQESDRESKLKAISAFIQDPDGEAEPEVEVPKPAFKDGGAPKRAEPSGLGHWSFKTRFEEEGAIVYRKHQAVLLGHIWLSSIAVLIIVGLLGARLGGLIEIYTQVTFLIACIIVLIPVGVWWVYGYLDWRDDIYMITPSHIFDVYRKPLRREQKDVAPLENILGTEVDRRGIFGLLLNFGDVRINIGAKQFDFEGVSDPTAVQQDIVRAQEALMERKQLAERQKRQDEMIEWLDVYHRLAGQSEE